MKHPLSQLCPTSDPLAVQHIHNVIQDPYVLANLCFPSMQVDVQHEVDGWLQVANIHGEVGLVPSSFVRILQPGEASPAAVGAAGAALSSAVSTSFDGLPGNSTCKLRNCVTHTPGCFPQECRKDCLLLLLSLLYVLYLFEVFGFVGDPFLSLCSGSSCGTWSITTGLEVYLRTAFCPASLPLPVLPCPAPTLLQSYLFKGVSDNCSAL